MRSRDPTARLRTVAALALVLVVVLSASADAHAAGYPALPVGDDRGFLGDLSAPSLAPGGSGTIVFSLGDPLTGPFSNASLTLQVYAFNAFPGNATSTVSVAGAPILTSGSTTGGSVTLPLGSLSPGITLQGSVGVVTSASTPSGTFAVRTALSFQANGSTYLLESRGWFTAAVWTNATLLPNGSATLNLSRLGVSGVLPETAVLVEASEFPIVLPLVLVAAAVLVGVGAWIYFRRGPASRSGTRSDGEDQNAPSAFGNSRTRDGD